MQWLLYNLGRAGAVEKIRDLLAAVRSQPSLLPGYSGANILHLCVALGEDLYGYDFSQLTIWQADLRAVILHHVSFRGSDLQGTIFRDTFSLVVKLDFSPDGQLLAAGTADGSITFWRVHEYRPHLIIQPDAGFISAMAFSNDGTVLITNSENGCLRLWDVETGECKRTLHEGGMGTIDINSRNGRIASGGDDGVVRMWDSQTGVCDLALKPTGPYDKLDITDAQGLSAAQVATLKMLGAVVHSKIKLAESLP
ncbi:MAG: WD40 repeat domain-containing protein [Anaerolineales bacterium]|nr:WD40 repeat domain-containing protein [Anaerolineales bacterium]